MGVKGGTRMNMLMMEKMMVYESAGFQNQKYMPIALSVWNTAITAILILGASDFHI